MARTEGLWDGYLPSDSASKINRDRQATYGDPTPNMVVLAQFWTVLFGVPITPQQAAMGLVLLKVMRETRADFPEGFNDNLEDICGWVNVIQKTKEAASGKVPE